MREKPVSGTKYFAGTLLREDGHIGRHIAVKFKCAHCMKGIGRAKFSCLKAAADKKYQTKSCRCQEEECFDRYHRTKAASTETVVARRIFESYALEGAKKTAKRFGISVYTANFVWQRWCRRLERKPESHRQQVFAMAQVSVRFAMDRFDYTKGEVLRICLHWKKGAAKRAEEEEIAEAATSEAIAAARSLFQQYAPMKSATGSIYDDVKLYIQWALNGINEDSGESGRYPPGEFTLKELASGEKRSDYKWVYETLRAMHPDHVKACFPKAGQYFLRACKRTLDQRIQRKRDHLKNLGKQQPIKPAKARNGVLATPGKRYYYLAKPTVSPGMIAKSFADYSLALKKA